MPWRTIEGEDLAPATMLELEVLIQGLFDKSRFLSCSEHFIVFEEEKSAASHQEDRRLPPVPRRAEGRGNHRRRFPARRGPTAAAWSGTPRDRARA